LRLEIPPGQSDKYRWAQLDDYLSLSRKNFTWRVPVTLHLEARVCGNDLPGTWGMGFWNDPFNASLGIRGTVSRLPALPNTAWFFYASPANYLTLHDHSFQPGISAAVFSSPLIPSLMLIPGLIILPFLFYAPLARMIRRFSRRLIQDSTHRLDLDCRDWHEYHLEAKREGTSFGVDSQPVWKTPLVPHGPLGLVLWIDNQYAAFTPDGHITMGTLANEKSAWLELRNLKVFAV
jgi:hypothetical protein